MKMHPRIVMMATALMAARPGLAAGTFSAQDASISAAGNIITAQRVPVQIGAGAPTYFDVTITLSGVEAGAVITNVKASAASTPSVIPLSDGFVAGTYKDPRGNVYVLGGPGVGPGGATAWSLSYVSGGTWCLLNGATWYTDTGVNNPEYARLKSDKISTTAYSFGTSSGQSGCSLAFDNGALIGAYQSGKTLTIVTYRNNSDNGDNSTPTANITFALQ